MKVGLPDKFSYKIGMFFEALAINVNITDINYDDIDLDLENTHIYYLEGYGKHNLKVDFPAIKKWDIKATQTINSWLYPSNSKVQLELKDFDLDF